MKTLARILGLCSAMLAGVVLRPVNSYQAFMVKSTATAQTPALAVLGALAFVLGFRQRTPFAALAGLFGAGVGASYIHQVTASHDGIERAFGPDWRAQLPSGHQHRMLRHRLTWHLPTTPEPRLTRDLPFATIPGSDRQLLADIWEPAVGVERSGLVIVYLYGGSWHFFDKDVLTRPLFRYLAAQGHVVMDAGHRSSPETDVFGMVADVHRAVAWIKEHAAHYGVERERVVLMGGSSGAHIALLAAYAPDEPRMKPGELQDADTSVAAVVSWYGIPDLEPAFQRWSAQESAGPPRPAWHRKEPGKVANRINTMILGRPLTAAQSPPAPPVRDMARYLLGAGNEDRAELYQLASPIHHVSSDCPPTLLFQGTHDAVVPLGSARQLHRVLETASVPVVYVEFPQTEHAFDLMYPPLANPAARSALYDLERFLACIAAGVHPVGAAHAPDTLAAHA